MLRLGIRISQGEETICMMNSLGEARAEWMWVVGVGLEFCFKGCGIFEITQAQSGEQIWRHETWRRIGKHFWDCLAGTGV